MVNTIRRALGFLLIPGQQHENFPEVPFLPEAVVCRTSALRGCSDKDNGTKFMLLKGHEEPEVLRRLRDVVVEREAPPMAGTYEDGLNLVVFRGVFGSGGYGIEVRDVTMKDRVLNVNCDYEDPGPGIRTTAGFTQPTAIIPLKRLPPGRYTARLNVRQFRRSSEGIQEQNEARRVAEFSFKVKAC
jgi:hypothetical protein